MKLWAPCMMKNTLQEHKQSKTFCGTRQMAFTMIIKFPQNSKTSIRYVLIIRSLNINDYDRNHFWSEIYLMDLENAEKNFDLFISIQMTQYCAK